jgi:hypothetical protein
VCRVGGRVQSRVVERWWRYGGRRGENKLRGCFVEEGIVVNVEGREKTPRELEEGG